MYKSQSKNPPKLSSKPGIKTGCPRHAAYCLVPTPIMLFWLPSLHQFLNNIL